MMYIIKLKKCNIGKIIRFNSIHIPTLFVNDTNYMNRS